MSHLKINLIITFAILTLCLHAPLAHAEIATLSLQQGWNLISLSLQPDNTSIDSVLASIQDRYRAVYAYDGISYLSYIPGASSNTLQTLNAGRGYWLFMDTVATLDVKGIPPSTSVQLMTGWNLVGYNSMTSMQVVSALSSVAGSYESVYAFNNQTNSYKGYIPGIITDLNVMEPGYGYWIYATKSTTWTLPSSTPTTPTPTPSGGGFYFPPRFQASLSAQSRKRPEEVGLASDIERRLAGVAGENWALWRHGYLVIQHGQWNKNDPTASLRKTWYAACVGAALSQGKISSMFDKVNKFQTSFKGKDAQINWFHLITQSHGLEFPGCDKANIDPEPGETWTYTDHTPKNLCDAIAKFYGKQGYNDNFGDAIKACYWDAIGMSGYTLAVREDGVWPSLDVEDYGRLGLLALARGRWEDKQVIPQWFIEELEVKQTYGMRAYEGCWDSISRSGDAPAYGYMTWIGSDGWAYGTGSGGHRIFWNKNNGVVIGGWSMGEVTKIIDSAITGPNPLFKRDLSPQNAYPNSIPHTVPGRIQAEYYDMGGSGVAYKDTTPGNARGIETFYDGDEYRHNDVDIRPTIDGGHEVSWIVSGEWLEYTINVGQAGTYNLTLRVSSSGSGGGVRVEFGGVDKTGNIEIPANSSYQTIQRSVNLSAGQQVMRLYMVGSGFNLNWIEITVSHRNDSVEVIT
jgi:hypothetical protein